MRAIRRAEGIVLQLCVLVLFVVLMIGFVAPPQVQAETIKGDYIKSLEIKAEQGDAGDQYNLALRYYNGQGVPQDYKQALKWFTKAAEQGHADAQINLSAIYYRGEGLPQDYKQAFKWLTKAVEQGHAAAQYQFGLNYGAGKYGVSKNHKNAYVWMSLAATYGYGKYAIEGRDYYAKSLTLQALSEAQEIARKKYAEIEARKNK